MIALSVRQPWAWLILNAGKDIENRTWPTEFRGKILIHAARKVDEFGLGDEQVEILGDPPRLIRLPEHYDLGGIVGMAEIVDCVRSHPSPWFAGPWGFVLANPRLLPFVAVRGHLGLFDAPYPANLLPQETPGR